MYPRKTRYNMKETWTLEVILAINLNVLSQKSQDSFFCLQFQLETQKNLN